MRLLTLSLFVCAMLVVGVYACKKDNPEPSVPVVTTVGLTNVTDSSVKVGGRITSTGNEEITTTGFCWSTMTTDPSISDDTSVSATTSETFVIELKNLNPSTTYYIRAYAVNSLGIGYGDVITFNTGNAAPEIDTIAVSGSVIVDSILTAAYTYSDFENDPDSGTVIQWYNTIDTALSGEIIVGADSATYQVAITDTSRFIRLGVTPFSSSGASPGKEVRSPWIGPVPLPL